MPLGKAFNETHLYHASKPAVVCYTDEDIAKAKADGYSETYIPQKYPKAMFKDVYQVMARNAAEEADLAKQGFKAAAGAA